MNFTEFKKEYKELTNKKERKEFIENRVMNLIGTDEKKIIGLGHCGNYKDFIAPHTEVATNGSGFFSNMIMDDFSIYEDFMNFINNDVNSYLYGEPSTIICVQQFVWKYFGLNAGTKFDRMDIYSTPGMKPLSISKLKEKNLAACAERSALVQNLLKFMGFDSEIMFGKINENNLHAYIVFQPENVDFKILYDPMNPVPFYEQENKKYAVAVSRIENSEYQDLMTGEKIPFHYDLIKKVYKLTEENQLEKKERVYSSDCHLYKKDTNNNTKR